MTLARTVRERALVDVPRRAMPAAVRAFERVRIDAVYCDLCERAIPRLRSLLDRGRHAWTQAERTRSESEAERARTLFDELLETLPPAPPGRSR